MVDFELAESLCDELEITYEYFKNKEVHEDGLIEIYEKCKKHLKN